MKRVPRGQARLNHDSPEAPLNGRSKLRLARTHPRAIDARVKDPQLARGPPSRRINFCLARAHLGRTKASSSASAKDLRNHEDMHIKCTRFGYLLHVKPQSNRGRQLR
jgi:hypothetical protein